MTATILRIPNEQHLARVREARRAAEMWVPCGFPPGREPEQKKERRA